MLAVDVQQGLTDAWNHVATKSSDEAPTLVSPTPIPSVTVAG